MSRNHRPGATWTNSGGYDIPDTTHVIWTTANPLERLPLLLEGRSGFCVPGHDVPARGAREVLYIPCLSLTRVGLGDGDALVSQDDDSCRSHRTQSLNGSFSVGQKF